MNPHLPAMPHQPPNIPPHTPRRQHDNPYAPPPQGFRGQPQYLSYNRYNPHMNHQYPPSQGPPQYYNWQTYQHMPGPPPAQYQPYTPLVVSSYPPPQPSYAPTHRPLQPIPPPTPVSNPSPAPSPIPLLEQQAVQEIQETRDVRDVRDAEAAGSVEGTEDDATHSVTQQETAVSGKSRQALVQGNFEPPFRAPVPWYSRPDVDFPPRAKHNRRRAKAPLSSGSRVVLPQREDQQEESIEQETAPESGIPPSLDSETDVTSQAPSETDSTQPTTPSSAVAPTRAPQTPTLHKPSRSIIPAVPMLPILPQSPTASKRGHRDSTLSATSKSTATQGPLSPTSGETAVNQPQIPGDDTSSTPAPAPAPAPPKSWADLVRSKIPANSVPVFGGMGPTNGHGSSKNEQLANVLNAIGADPVQEGGKIAFVEPRGLVNTGNMCYMNSVLQVLIFCIPFYDFLDRISQRAAHKFKSDTPLIDAMIMFMREFRVIDAADSVEQLRLRLKQSELEQYGEAFTPEYVYQAIREIPRFRDMRRGHQQDAQEFLGFLLEELHEECAHILKSATPSVASGSSSPKLEGVNGDPIIPESQPEDGWMEVGHKQKAAVTRSSGAVATESPITRIFGGKIRSEWRVPGNKNSVTLEPYQSLQLDIGSPNVSNITDALKGLTRPENIQGDFSSARGPKTSATKQVFLETLPPVLTLHLKRFQYDSATKTTQKIWKKVGYPLELEIPKEVFPQHKRGVLAVQSGLPRYRLMGVIYHHGKSASGGHYTIDVRREDGKEWIRLDDTVIRRVRNEEVAHGGSEEDPKLLAAALEKHKELSSNANIYEQMEKEQEEQRDSEKGWNQVNGTGSGSGRKASLGVNGMATPALSSGKRTPNNRYGVKDNKVAYLLFYEKIRG